MKDINKEGTSQSIDMNSRLSLLNAIFPPFSNADQIFEATAAVILASLWASVPAYAKTDPSLFRSLLKNKHIFEIQN